MAKSHTKPRFVREESWRYKRVKESWRSPRGKTSRVRRSKRGWPAVVKIGYASPTSRRHIHPSGLKEVMVWRLEDLEKVDPKTQVARIAHTVGENKRVRILEQAKKVSIRVLNPRLKKAEVAAEAVPTEEAAEVKQEETAEVKKEETTVPPEKAEEEE